MTETELKPTPEPVEEVPETEPQPKLKIESLDDMKRIMIIARGGDPDAIQAISDFMDLRSNIERSYLPDKKTTICVAQLTGWGDVYFPQDEWDPFNLVANALAVAYMPYKGFKSNQFVDMTRQTPSLSELESYRESAQERGLMDRILNRGGGDE